MKEINSNFSVNVELHNWHHDDEGNEIPDSWNIFGKFHGTDFHAVISCKELGSKWPSVDFLETDGDLIDSITTNLEECGPTISGFCKEEWETWHPDSEYDHLGNKVNK